MAGGGFDFEAAWGPGGSSDPGRFDEAGRYLHEVYQGFLRGGFNRDQAFQLLLAFYSWAMASSTLSDALNMAIYDDDDDDQ